MKTVSPFRELDPAAQRVTIRWQGRDLVVPAGNLAAALLVAGIMPFRHTPVSAAPRGPFCMMGACFDCLVEIDGVNRQACMIEAAEGMAVAMPRVENRE
ncbi:(2Fe-2S)-binding protein [Zhengella mangrovi]|uniref:(2Fe-2S)-binding protein n=1 Tax=Zhengella mangrovi TaxID=1982044 RepID=UPI0026C38D1B